MSPSPRPPTPPSLFRTPLVGGVFSPRPPGPPLHRGGTHDPHDRSGSLWSSPSICNLSFSLGRLSSVGPVSGPFPDRYDLLRVRGGHSVVRDSRPRGGGLVQGESPEPVGPSVLGPSYVDPVGTEDDRRLSRRLGAELRLEGHPSFRCTGPEDGARVDVTGGAPGTRRGVLLCGTRVEGSVLGSLVRTRPPPRRRPSGEDAGTRVGPLRPDVWFRGPRTLLVLSGSGSGFTASTRDGGGSSSCRVPRSDSGRPRSWRR